MNRRRQIAAGALCALLTAVQAAMPCAAAQERQADRPYGYTVTFYAGGQGKFSQAGRKRIQVSRGKNGLLTEGQDYEIEGAGSRVTVSGLRQGDLVAWNVQAEGDVALQPGSEYYVKGFRKSGMDNDEADVDVAAFPVTRDVDYVVAYGIHGELTPYTVNYLAEDGTVLAPADTYWGNIGDRAVVAFRYIEGYEPQSYNQRMELTGKDDSFTFIYRQIPPQAPTPGTPAPQTPALGANSQGTAGGTTGQTTAGTTGQTTTGTTGQTTSGTVTGGTAAGPEAGGAETPAAAEEGGTPAAGPEAPGAAEEPAQAGGAEAPGAGASGGTTAEEPEEGLQPLTEEQVPQGLVDLDSGEEVPLADLGGLSAGLEEEDGGRILYPQVAGGILLLGAAIGTGLYFKKKKAVKGNR